MHNHGLKHLDDGNYVVNLTRSTIFKADSNPARDPNILPAHILVTGPNCSVDVADAAFIGLGRTMKNLPISTAAGTKNYIPAGTTINGVKTTQKIENRKGRYAFHFHGVEGPVKAIKSSVFIGPSESVAIAVHGSDGISCRDNISTDYRTWILGEHGDEQSLEVCGNFFSAGSLADSKINEGAFLTDLDTNDLSHSGIWLGTPGIITHADDPNIATFRQRTGFHIFPVRPGAKSPAAAAIKEPMNVEGLVAFCCGVQGINVWTISGRNAGPALTPDKRSYFSDFTVENCGIGIEINRFASDIEIHDLEAYGNGNGMAVKGGIGGYSGYISLVDCVIDDWLIGFQEPNLGINTVMDCEFSRCKIAIQASRNGGMTPKVLELIRPLFRLDSNGTDILGPVGKSPVYANPNSGNADTINVSLIYLTDANGLRQQLFSSDQLRGWMGNLPMQTITDNASTWGNYRFCLASSPFMAPAGAVAVPKSNLFAAPPVDYPIWQVVGVPYAHLNPYRPVVLTATGTDIGPYTTLQPGWNWVRTSLIADGQQVLVPVYWMGTALPSITGGIVLGIKCPPSAVASDAAAVAWLNSHNAAVTAAIVLWIDDPSGLTQSGYPGLVPQIRFRGTKATPTAIELTIQLVDVAAAKTGDMVVKVPVG